jgi:hypothetical protein
MNKTFLAGLCIFVLVSSSFAAEVVEDENVIVLTEENF